MLEPRTPVSASQYILSIDLGTGGPKVSLVGDDGAGPADRRAGPRAEPDLGPGLGEGEELVEVEVGRADGDGLHRPSVRVKVRFSSHQPASSRLRHSRRRSAGGVAPVRPGGAA